MKHLLLFRAGFGLLAGPAAMAQPLSNAQTFATDDDLRFCGEQLPQYLPTVAQRWQKTLSRRARYADDLLEIQKQAAVIFPIIEPILAQYAVPKDMKYLALVESELNEHALSRKGAAGIWQLMPQTARKLGLSTRRRNDERYNLVKATHAACQYLWELYRQTGSWMLAASAYNAGPTYIAQLAKQFPTEHPLMLPFAKAETQAYVYQAIAYKELLSRPEHYADLLTSRAVLALSQRVGVVTPAERQTILAAIEQPHPEADEQVAETTTAAFLPAKAVVMLTPETPAASRPAEVRLTDVRPVATTAATAPRPVAEAAPPAAHHWPSVRTRNLTNERVTEGQQFVFEVVNAQEFDGQTLSVGDLVYAYVELIEPNSGRVYLRADRVVSSQTRETLPLKLVAVEKSRQRGVPMPMRDAVASGWQLTWEKL
ncbi:lytic transglycosylase domain-containing protein [Fibrella sp. HMF5335]|uniref:Lytic transglycosylase domain-containing protein n=1 Tax=Fibrella rubiginis TaxID=2817060 RepID=A0A939K677_9BACT|nr:lytic transglycosylase domain-containing protein [Fibrella rubiginis]MBO0938558.1 lytic transglycosylase domain-containing protein [Fibrella rubiginis]